MPNIETIDQLIRTQDLSTKAINYAKANISASATDSSVVAAVTNNKIRVLAIHCQCGATATDITFNSGSTAISPLFANAANGGAVLDWNPAGWFETTNGAALTATTGAGSTTGITVVYAEVRIT